LDPAQFETRSKRGLCGLVQTNFFEKYNNGVLKMTNHDAYEPKAKLHKLDKKKLKHF